MLRKIITYFLILAAVLPALAAAVPLGVKVSYAESATTETSGNSSVSSPCSFDSIVTDRINKFLEEKLPLTASVGEKFGLMTRSPGGGSVWNCALYTITFLLYEVVMRISILIAGWASDLFNVSIQFSLTGEAFDADKNIMIKDGWTYIRDLLNLVFIFILLYAAISTILQYGNMDIKKILPSLIVVALLVNFSLMIAKMVIDASHIFAWEFYNQIDVENKDELGNKETFANMQGSVEVNRNFEKKNLANVFLAGFNPQRLLIESEIVKKGDTEKRLPAWKEVYEHATKNKEDIVGTLWKMIFIILLESALAIFASFILLAGAIMFIVRVVVLWMVMIFSPIAFLGIILPSMDKYSSQWWGYLINQSFFAPAFLFMFMLATKFINNDLVDSLLKINPNPDAKIVEGLQMGAIVVIFFNFFVVAFIFSLCLVVAQKLGGKTAEFGVSGANRIKGWALGGANKMLWKPTRYGLSQVGKGAVDSIRYAGGKAGDSGWWAKSIGKIPGGNILGRKLGAMKKADEDKARKVAEKYASGLSKEGLISLKRDTEGKGFAKRFMYTGPEGAFTPGKEGYQNIIAKKKSEEDEKVKHRKKLAELANYKDDKDSKGNIVKGGSKEDKVKRRLDRGQRKELDEEIEKTTKKIADAYKKAAEVIEDRITTTAVDLTEKNSRLYKAIEDGEPVAVIGAIKSEIIKLEKDKNKFNGQKIIMDKKKKEREDKEKAVEKYEAKQDTEKLGAKFSSSGAGGGGGKGGGGGGKTTP